MKFESGIYTESIIPKRWLKYINQLENASYDVTVPQNDTIRIRIVRSPIDILIHTNVTMIKATQTIDTRIATDKDWIIYNYLHDNAYTYYLSYNDALKDIAKILSTDYNTMIYHYLTAIRQRDPNLIKKIEADPVFFVNLHSTDNSYDDVLSIAREYARSLV